MPLSVAAQVHESAAFGVGRRPILSVAARVTPTRSPSRGGHRTFAKVAQVRPFRPDPMYVAGDSQAVVYGDRVVLGYGPRGYVTRALCCGVLGGDLGGVDETLHEAFALALAGGGVVARVGGGYEAFHASGDAHVRSLAFVDQRERCDPPIVLACGGLDCARIGRDIPFDDIELPPDLNARFDVPIMCSANAQGAAPWFEMLTLAHDRMAGLRRGLRVLRRMGFGRLAILSLPPPTDDESLFMGLRKTLALPIREARQGPRLRYKLVLLMNDVLLRICREEGVDFIDRWSEQTRDGIVRPGVLVDAIHVTSAEADRTVDVMARWAAHAPSTRAQAAPVGAA